MNKLNIKQYIQFLIVGGLGVFINYFIYMPFRDRIFFDVTLNLWSSPFLLHIDLLWFAGIGVSATSNYILNAWWTFNNDKSN
jgi:putative flippase GtrA